MKKRNLKTNKKFFLKLSRGHTLIELLLYVSLSAAMLLSISMAFFVFFESRIKNQTILEVDGEGTQAMQLITQTIRNAIDVNSPAIGTNDASLSLNISDPLKDPTVFDLLSDEIRITEGVNPAVSLTNATKVITSGLLFENLSRASTPDTISVSFTLSHTNPSNKNEYNYSRSFYGSASFRH